MKSAAIPSSLLKSGESNPYGVWGFSHLQLLGTLQKENPSEEELIKSWREDAGDLPNEPSVKELNRLIGFSMKDGHNNFKKSQSFLLVKSLSENQNKNVDRLYIALMKHLQRKIKEIHYETEKRILQCTSNS